MYMLDVTFLSEHDKFVSGVLTALSAMMQVKIFIINKSLIG